MDGDGSQRFLQRLAPGEGASAEARAAPPDDERRGIAYHALPCERQLTRRPTWHSEDVGDDGRQAIRGATWNSDDVPEGSRTGRGSLMKYLSHVWKVMGKLVIDPTVRVWVDIWDLNLAGLLVVIAFLTPYETVFLHPNLNTIFVFDRLVDAFFLVDMAIQFILAYPDPDRPERLVKAPPAIVLHYLRGWFWVDAMSLLPVDIYCAITSHTRTGPFGLDLKVVRMLRLVRLLRLTRFTRIQNRWHTSFGFSYAKLTLLKFFTSVILCCHWMACLWGGVALHLQAQGEVNWVDALRDAKQGEDSLYQNAASVYGISLYWAIISLTTIGYGDITPQSSVEYWAAAVCTSVMACIWAYVIGSVCTIVSTLQPHEIHFKRTMDDLNQLMADRSMPAPMCKRLRRYFHEAREINKQHIEEAVIEQMSPMLQGECAMFLHSRWIQKVWYLRDMNREIIIWAARNLSLMIYAPNEEILEERTLFIVRRGVCAHRGKVLVSGDIWGEDMLLSNDNLRDRNNARSLSYLSVLRLHIADLFDVVVSFPEAKARLRWAQVRIATMRGVVLLASTLRFLEASHAFDRCRLSEPQLSRLYRDILQRTFNTDSLHIYLREDYQASPRACSAAVAAAASPRCHASGSRSSLAPMVRSGTLGDCAGSLTFRSAGSVLEQLAPQGQPTRTFSMGTPSQVAAAADAVAAAKPLSPARAAPCLAACMAAPMPAVLEGLVENVAELRASLARLELKVDNIRVANAGSSRSRRSKTQRELAVDFRSSSPTAAAAAAAELTSKNPTVAGFAPIPAWRQQPSALDAI